MRNDTNGFVMVKDCRTSACDRYRYTKRPSGGASVAAKDYGDGTSHWLVTDRQGHRLGCLTLGRDKRVGGYVLRLSNMVTCPN